MIDTLDLPFSNYFIILYSSGKTMLCQFTPKQQVVAFVFYHKHLHNIGMMRHKQKQFLQKSVDIQTHSVT